MPLLPSNFIEEICTNPDSLGSLKFRKPNKHVVAEMIKHNLSINGSI